MRQSECGKDARLIAALRFLVPFNGLFAAIGVVVAAASATQIQL
jgi:hypothetical protein